VEIEAAYVVLSNCLDGRRLVLPFCVIAENEPALLPHFRKPNVVVQVVPVIFALMVFHLEIAACSKLQERAGDSFPNTPVEKKRLASTRSLARFNTFELQSGPDFALWHVEVVGDFVGCLASLPTREKKTGWNAFNGRSTEPYPRINNHW